MLLNLELYRVFYITAQQKSFSHAASQLFITQPSVSHAIKQLEEKLGLQLFQRTAKGVKLTKEGEVLFKYVEQACNAIENAERKMSELKNLTSGEIRIGGSDSLCKHYLLPHIQTFYDEYPEVQIRLRHGTTAKIVEYLKDGQIDFGLVHLPVEDKQLRIFEYVTIHSCFVAGLKHQHLSKNPTSIAQLSTYPLISFSKNSSSSQFLKQFFHSHGHHVEPEIELGSVDLLIESAKIGLGIAFATKELVRNELANNTLFEVNLQEVIPPRKVGIITLKDVPLSVASAAFIDRLLQGT